MIRISLPEAEVGRLEEVIRATADAKWRHRAQIVLMAHRGRRHADIAADTGTSHRSVTRWLNAYLDALRPQKAKGATPKLTPDLANLVDSPKDAKRRTGKSKTRRMQEGFAAHLRHVARMYPAAGHPRVVLVIDNAPWHRGKGIDDALRDHPHLEFYRLPSYSPQLNPIERFWRVLRRRATHNRLFDTLADLRRSIRSNLSYYQTMRQRVRTLLNGRPRKQTPSTGS